MKYRLKQKKRAFRTACGVALNACVRANMRGGSNRREKKTIKRIEWSFRLPPDTKVIPASHFTL